MRKELRYFLTITIILVSVLLMLLGMLLFKDYYYLRETFISVGCSIMAAGISTTIMELFYEADKLRKLSEERAVTIDRIVYKSVNLFLRLFEVCGINRGLSIKETFEKMDIESPAKIDAMVNVYLEFYITN